MSEDYLPRISIIIPSFNQGHYLEHAIQSVLSQDYQNTELIIIDGGSTDGSLDILEKFADQLSYWESCQDRGQSHAINKGFSCATGDIITFLSSDDLYLPGVFIFVVEKFQTYPHCGAIVGGFHFVDENNNISQVFNPPRLPYHSPIDLTLIPPEDWRLHQVATFYTKHALDEVGRYVREDLNYVMDRELLFRVCKRFEIVLDNRPYGAFRRHLSSKSMNAGILFSGEFAQLYLEAKGGDKREDHIRDKIARFFRAKGYLHFAKYHSDKKESKKAIINAIKISPLLLIRKSIVIQIIKIFCFKR